MSGRKNNFLKVFLVSLVVFFSAFSSAASILDELHLNLQTTDGSGNVVTGTFDFQFDISTTSDCSNVIYSDSATLTTDSRGIISYYLSSASMNYDQQYYLCYYRDTVLIDTAKVARAPYAFRAKYVNVSGIQADSNLDLTGYNLSADYLIGDGSGLTNINVSAINLSSYFTKLDILGFGYYNSSDFNISDYYLASNPNNYLNESTLNLSNVNYWNKSGSKLYYNGGNVGIGTSNPSQALEVNGNIIQPYDNVYYAIGNNQDIGIVKKLGGPGFFSYGSASDFTIRQSNASTIASSNSFTTRLTLDSNGRLTTTGSLIAGGDNSMIGGLANSNFGIVKKSGEAQPVVAVGSGNPIRFGQWSTSTITDSNIASGSFSEEMRIDSDGNVGIGETNPSYKLDVAGDVNAYQYLVNGTPLDANSLGAVTGSGTAGYLPVWDSNTSLNNSPIYANGSSVGIGTNNPVGTKLLTISDVNNPATYTQAGAQGIQVVANNGGGIYMSEVGGAYGKYEAYGNQLGVGTMNSFPLTFWTSNQQRAIFDTQGRFGIGSTSPSRKLDVNGTAIIRGNLDMDGNAISNLANASSAQDAVTKSQLDTVNAQLSGNVSENYVPYVGATKNVDLGNNNFTVGGNDFIVNNNAGQIAVGTNYFNGKINLQANSMTPIISTTRSDNTQKGTLSYDGWGNYVFNNRLTVGSDTSISGTSATLYVDGNVGVGTTNPSQKLEVEGNVNVTQNITISGMTIYKDTAGDMVFRA